jgi:hypothetical protein
MPRLSVTVTVTAADDRRQLATQLDEVLAPRATTEQQRGEVIDRAAASAAVMPMSA